MSGSVKIKVCGMKTAPNIEEVASLNPDYMGFIFSKESTRFVGKDFDPAHLNLLDPSTKATGVFVNEFLPTLLDKVDFYHFDAIQLHGDETSEYCKKVRAALPDIEIIKAFGIDEKFDFNALTAYAPHVSSFLFDTKGEKKGGNGAHFDWTILERYTLTVPFFLSGGIGVESLTELRAVVTKYPLLKGIDVNSKFEVSPGVKSKDLLTKFVDDLKSSCN